MNILDIAQNSIRAGARLVSITVGADTALDRLDITVSDDGCGMTPEQARQVTDPFFTTRTTRKVGLGVPLLKMAAELTGGALEIESAPGQGTAVRARFGLGHIDRMPLGDMAATYCSLVQCNPGITFVYTLRVNGAEFCADTRQFQAVLDDVPLQEPQVIAFIGAYIRENMADLHAAAL